MVVGAIPGHASNFHLCSLNQGNENLHWNLFMKHTNFTNLGMGDGEVMGPGEKYLPRVRSAIFGLRLGSENFP